MAPEAPKLDLLSLKKQVMEELRREMEQERKAREEEFTRLAQAKEMELQRQK
jgi:hypothetical protein